MIVPKPLQVFTCPKNLVSTSPLINLESTTADHDSPHSVLPTSPLLPTVEMDTPTSSHLDLPIADRKSKQSCT